MTWGFMDRLELMQRWCGWCRCVACIIVAPAGIAMHPGAAGCTWCIIGNPGERCPAGTASCEGRTGPPHHWSHHAPDLAASCSRCTWCIPAPRETDVPAAASSPVSYAARRRAADVVGTPRSRRPADAPGLDLLHGRADPYP